MARTWPRRSCALVASCGFLALAACGDDTSAGGGGTGGSGGGSGAMGGSNAGGAGGGDTACQAPLQACGAECVLTAADPLHCGDCDTACADGEICLESACV